ncbi:MAG TPA: GNAT family N-acetyltransferase [Frankiaceae bacterium]|nr:GNAT family N-acetyltransferase [Frankiaceae bacterium]
MTVTVRPATRDDLAAVYELTCGFDAREPGDPDEEFRARYERILGRDDWALLVADAGGTLAGYALVQDFGPGLRRGFSTGRMHDLYVAEPHRRRGAGRALMAAVTAWARARQYPLILDWSARLDSVPFYDSLGLRGDPVGDNARYPAYCLDFRAERGPHSDPERPLPLEGAPP